VKRVLTLLVFLLALAPLQGQQDFLAKQYYADGEFGKAVVFYEKLVSANPRRMEYLEQLVSCYHQLEQYDKAISLLRARIETGSAHPTTYIDLGYTHFLKGDPQEAERWYESGLELIEANPGYGYMLGFKFQRYTLLDYALRAYQRAMELNPELDYNTQVARIYGEQGNIGAMFGAYLDLMAEREAIKPNVFRILEDFVSTDPGAENNVLLKQALLGRAQENPDPLWNEILSWLFVRQQQFGSALVQEKALYRRLEGGGLDRLSSLGRMAESAGDFGAARAAFDFVVKESSDPVARLNAQLHLLDITLEERPDPNLKQVQNTYEDLMEAYGYNPGTLQLQISYANFLTFRLGTPGEAIAILKKSLELPIPNYTEGYLKTTLGDVLVYTQAFNEALILYSQVQKLLKNDVMGQQARFKVAQTSFYKGDFEWAQTQLKVLRNSTSQLIANDAMQLSLVISDNSLEDSTRAALRKYARADLLAYQQNRGEALALLDELLQQHKGERIEDEALLMQGRLLEAEGDYSGARLSYLKIIEFYGQDILADDAHFALGELYRTRLGEPEKAMEQYQEILFRYQDSYYFPEARKQFRILRGDPVQ
jgi:tetratricopeptide (TPR) repeat protein